MTEPRELRSIRDLRSAAGDDALLLWAAGEPAGGTRAFSLGAATAVAAPGVATAKQARGRGLGAAVCGLALDGLVAEHGRAALIVDSWNTAAVGLYRTLGLSWRPLAAARVAGN